MGKLPKRSLPFLDYKESPEVDNAFLVVNNEAANLRNSLPDHYEYLARLRCGDPHVSWDSSPVDTIRVQFARG
jgi:hypothetical protein